MRRADRLFQIVQFLRGRRLTTARWLADRLEVSERTVYRDVRDLCLSGVPIEGEAGVGYVLRHKLDLPPLMFDREELAALRLGAEMVVAWSDPQLARAAEAALAKIRSELPTDMLHGMTPMHAPAIPGQHEAAFAPLRNAIDKQKIVRLYYRKPDGQADQRDIWPLGLFFWGKVWTLVAWCELRNAHRQFRLDRIETNTVLDQDFRPSYEQTLRSALRAAGVSSDTLD
ncbi:helix-turn-helix transcriptional regulator [Chitinimonas sp. BJB300]|uniref:helix-turn-helix transcriptional regulator n=1 Tax=Chitinimonas sp. BJB300 TaxID=1559339 RepID=UPI000C10336D|nr:YafY family protein [Chitinimonas sp. BJB300]PHV12359.1 DNA-binding transcriptional regulator [Chitinimonas sp. BJB300]TSJ91069.1 YafY family transcriptional regulator [Chitinimonas sp. BJB300]